MNYLFLKETTEPKLGNLTVLYWLNIYQREKKQPTSKLKTEVAVS